MDPLLGRRGHYWTLELRPGSADDIYKELELRGFAVGCGLAELYLALGCWGFLESPRFP